MKTVQEINVGIDSSKTQLDIYIRPHGDYFSVENTAIGIKVVLIACMNKMITVLNTMVKNDQIWNDKFA